MTSKRSCSAAAAVIQFHIREFCRSPSQSLASISSARSRPIASSLHGNRLHKLRLWPRLVTIGIFAFSAVMPLSASSDVFDEWEKCKKGDRSALALLTDLGPDSAAICREVVMSIFEDDPLLPKENKWELLQSFQADGVPSIIASMEGFDEDQRLIVLQNLESFGRMARPGLPYFLQQLSKNDDETRLLLCKLIVECSPSPPGRITEELMSIVEAPTIYGPNAIGEAILLLVKLSDENALRELRRLASEHGNALVRQHAMYALATGVHRKFAPFVLIDRIDDMEFVNGTPSCQPTNSIAALQLLLDFESLPEEVGSQAVSAFYRSTFDESIHLDPNLMWQLICNCERISPETRALIKGRIWPLLTDDAWVSAQAYSPRQTKIAAAAVVHFACPDLRPEARRFLLAEVAKPDNGDAGMIEERTMAARVLCKLRAAEPEDAALLKGIVSESNAAEMRELQICTAIALAATDPTETSCLSVFRVKGLEGYLDMNRISLKKLREILGQRRYVVWQFSDLINSSDAGEAFEGATDIGPARIASQVFPDEMNAYLVQQLASTRTEGVVAALKASPGISSKTPQLLKAITERLLDRRIRVRVAAAQALGACGSVASASLPELRQAITSQSLSLQIAAQDAIDMIQSGRPTQTTETQQ